MDKILKNFKIETDNLIPIKKSVRVLIQRKKRTWQREDIVIPVDHGMKIKESENEQFLDLARDKKKAMSHEGDDYVIGTILKGL